MKETNPIKAGQSGLIKKSTLMAAGASGVRKVGTAGKPVVTKSTHTPGHAIPAVSSGHQTGQGVAMRHTGLSLGLKYAIVTAVIITVATLFLAVLTHSVAENVMDTEINRAGIRLVKALSVVDIDFWEKKSQEAEKRPDTNPLPYLDVSSTVGEKVGAKEPTILNVAITKKTQTGEFYLLSMRARGEKLMLRDSRDIVITSEDIDIKEGLYGESRTGVEVRTRLFQKKILDRDGLHKGNIYLFLSAKEIDEALNRLVGGFVLPSLLSIIVGAVLGFLMASQVTKPVKTLMTDMQAVSGGDLEHQSSVKTNDEVGVLAKAFNQMTLSLKDAHQKEMETKALERELNIAREIQYNLLPKELPQVSDYDISAHYKPCYEVSGDYYDLMQLDSDNIGVVVADVSGKGVPASMIMTMARSLIRMESERNMSPASILSKVNRILARDIRRGMFVTALYYVLNTKTGVITVASAGHNPLVIWRHDAKRHELINPNGIALGFDRGPVFERTIKEQTATLGVYDRVVTYTDGVTESMNEADEEFGGERFYQLTGQLANHSSSRFIESLINTLEQFKGSAAQHDDITIVSIKRII